MLECTTINAAHDIATIQSSLATQGYYLANNDQVCDHDVLTALVEQLGGIWQQAGVQTIAPADNARFVAHTTDAIPPHTECAYAAQPPRYLLLHCRENTVVAGDFYLIDSAEVITHFAQETLGLLYHSHFHCLIDPNHPQRVTVLKQNARGFYLQYTCIGHSEDWLNNHSYQPIAPVYQGYEQIIPLIQQQLRRKNLRRYHSWQAGDLLIFDNQRFLHGRDAFRGDGRCLDHIRIAGHDSVLQA